MIEILHYFCNLFIFFALILVFKFSVEQLNEFGNLDFASPVSIDELKSLFKPFLGKQSFNSTDRRHKLAKIYLTGIVNIDIFNNLIDINLLRDLLSMDHFVSLDEFLFVNEPTLILVNTLKFFRHLLSFLHRSCHFDQVCFNDCFEFAIATHKEKVLHRAF